MSTAAVLRRGGVAPAALVNPSSISGLVARYVADDIALTDGAAVSSWADRAATPHAATQATGTKQPLYKTAIFNGHAAVRFDGVDDFLRSALVQAQPDTLFVAMRSLVGASGVRSFVDGATNNAHVFRSVSNWDIYAGGAVISGPAADSTAHVFCAVYNGASSKIRVGGGAGTGGNAGAGTLAALNIGCGGDQASFPANIDVAELLVYSGSLSLADMNSVGAYLGSTYGMTWATAT